MSAATIRVAYALFFFSFSMWIALLLSVCFQNGQWANPIQFPSFELLEVFIISAVASSIACMIIGFEYLDLGKGFSKRARNFASAKSAKVRLRKASLGGSDTLDGNYFVLSNLEDESEDLNLLVLVNKRGNGKLQVRVRDEPCEIDQKIIVINPSNADPA
jgi:hypothetical protein